MQHLAGWLFSAPAYNITCDEIGNCPQKVQTLDMGFAAAVQLLIGVIGGLAVIFIIVSGLQMVLSNGDAKRFQQGRQSLFYSVVGVILAITAYTIVTFISGAL